MQALALAADDEYAGAVDRSTSGPCFDPSIRSHGNLQPIWIRPDYENLAGGEGCRVPVNVKTATVDEAPHGVDSRAGAKRIERKRIRPGHGRQAAYEPSPKRRNRPACEGPHATTLADS